MKALKLILSAITLFIMACDDNKTEQTNSDVSSNYEELLIPEDHAINLFINTYHLDIKKIEHGDTVSFLIQNTGRTKEEIEELMVKGIPKIHDYDYITDENELSKYRKMYNDTCFNASGFTTYTTLDTIASIKVVCNNTKGDVVNIDGTINIQYDDIKKIVGTNLYAGRHISAYDLDWTVNEPLEYFNKRTDNYLLRMGEVILRLPIPKESGEYYYSITYMCTNGRQFILKESVNIRK